MRISGKKKGAQTGNSLSTSRMMGMITDYFMRKRDHLENQYDPVNDIDMLITMLKGQAITSICPESSGYENNEKALIRIIQIFK